MSSFAPLDPQVQSFLEAAERSAAAPLYTLSPTDARAQYAAGVAAMAGTPPTVDEVFEHSVATTQTHLRFRAYRQSPPQYTDRSNLRPLLLYFHGGGWSFGNLDTHDTICRWLCAESGCVVASLDYRLAPEHKFPAAVDDAYAAFEWAAGHAEELGADSERIAVGGDSAGGTLAAVVSMQARDNGGPKVGFQLLIYPATDMTMSCDSHRQFGEGYRLTRPLMAWSASNYLRDGCDMMDTRASPLLAHDHSGLPPALVMTAGFDPLQDEGKAYADALKAAGVTVKHVHYAGMIHGFIGMPGIFSVAGDALREAGAALKSALFD